MNDAPVHPCSVCGAPGRQYMNTKACPLHTPAAMAGHPEPPDTVCAKPLTCYRSCCATKLPPVEPQVDANALVEQWKTHARAEIMTLAGLGYPFGPAELAAVLPVKLAGDRAREWVLWLLDEGIEAGAIVAVGPNQWKGARQ